MSELTNTRLIIYAAIFMLVFDNAAFFLNVCNVYPVSNENIWFLASLAIGIASLTVLVLSLVSYRPLIKPALIILLLISSSAAYFMDTYNVVINDSMIRNIVNTDEAEIRDLLNMKLFLYVLFLGVLPSWYVYRVKIIFKPGWKQILLSIKTFSAALLLLAIVIYTFSDFYSSFFREHKILRFYANPVYYIYSSGKYLNSLSGKSSAKIKLIGQDAEIPASDNHSELVIFVVGETARSDNFSLNGYQRETNPLLKKEGVISFPNFWSCATSTEFAVPCMFSMYDKSHFNIE
ncbi:MAG TPA: phosphoethanolamine transferase domain-containing protein, partial [Gammaproteobacteria bacterium]|nr:phosphoethanolamine transferase domain-containing protein [Gammaproteobacteria bacterium]